MTTVAALRSFAGNLRVRLQAARRLGLARTCVRACRKTGVLDARALRRWELLHDERIGRPVRMREFLDRYETLATERCEWGPLSFAGMRVLEIGCGPFGGWGPLAVFRGAATYVGIDPAMDPELLYEPQVAAAYLRPVHQDLAARSGAGEDFETFLTNFRARTRFVAAPIQTLAGDETFDRVVSNSCLEHIDGFDAFAEHLAARLSPGARMLHLVDFSSHRSKEAPFQALYEMPPEVYRRRYGRHINLLRAPDMQAALEHRGLRVRWIAVDTRTDALDGIAVNRWWSRRYDRETLALRAALLVAEVPAAITATDRPSNRSQ